MRRRDPSSATAAAFRLKPEATSPLQQPSFPFTGSPVHRLPTLADLALSTFLATRPPRSMSWTISAPHHRRNHGGSCDLHPVGVWLHTARRRSGGHAGHRQLEQLDHGTAERQSRIGLESILRIPPDACQERQIQPGRLARRVDGTRRRALPLHHRERAGSDTIRNKVLKAVLKREQELVAEGIDKAALTDANYVFDDAGEQGPGSATSC